MLNAYLPDSLDIRPTQCETGYDPANFPRAELDLSRRVAVDLNGKHAPESLREPAPA